MKTINIAKISKTATLPTRKHADDAGLDLYSDMGETFVLPGEVTKFNTGVKIDIPKGFVGLIWPKSKTNFLIGAGVVDAGYQGEIIVKVVNNTQYSLLIDRGEAIAQLVIVPVMTPRVVEVTEEEIFTTATDRGATGGILSGDSLVGLLKEDETLESFLYDNRKHLDDSDLI